MTEYPPSIAISGQAVRDVVDAFRRVESLDDDATEATALAAWDELSAALDVLTERWIEYRATAH